MEVIEYKSGAWFFLKEGDDFYINVSCSRGFADFSVAVQLNGSEKMHYLEQGVDFINDLGDVIALKSDIDHPRNINNKELLADIHESIMQWKQRQT
ncbi:hypothetical protein [Alcanivorax sp.]|uniref:hypothetical protein n=1 Tax=Alcanivorax sp. TaxID=1872427 RepID=UPI003BA9DE2A